MSSRALSRPSLRRWTADAPFEFEAVQNELTSVLTRVPPNDVAKVVKMLEGLLFILNVTDESASFSE